MELSHPTPFSKMGILDVTPKHHDLGIAGAKLVLPGSPEKSVLLERIARRGKDQMPPLASNEIDQQAVVLIRKWDRRAQYRSASLGSQKTRRDDPFFQKSKAVLDGQSHEGCRHGTLENQA
jgi:hypothetical protein